MESFGDPIWEKLFSSQQWGKYPSEEAIRFFFAASARLKKRPLTVLDLGCGKGAVTWFMRHEGAEVTAMDGAPSGLKQVPELAAHFGIHDGITTVLGDITEPAKFVQPGYDLIIDHYSLCANPKSKILNACRQINSLLAPGGFFFSGSFGTNTDGYGSGIEIEPGFYRDVREGVFAGRGGIGFYTENELAQLLTDAGMKVEYSETILQIKNGLKTEKVTCCASKT